MAPSEENRRTWGDLTQNVYIRTLDDDVLIETGVEKVNIQGNQFVQVRLTRKEIVNLVRIAWRNKPFGELFDALSKTPASAHPR